MGLTSDRHDGCLHEIDPATGMQWCYLVLPDGARRDLKRPVKRTYVHTTCGVATTMAQEIAETYAADPTFYGGTYCVGCRAHYRVGALGRFVWDDDTLVGTDGMKREDRDRRVLAGEFPLPDEVAV